MLQKKNKIKGVYTSNGFYKRVMSDDNILAAKMKMLSAKASSAAIMQKREETKHMIFVLMEELREEVFAGVFSHRSADLTYHLEQNSLLKKEFDNAMKEYDEAASDFHALNAAASDI